MPEQCFNLINDLVNFRKSKGLTQKELAKAVGFSQSVIARIESKKSVPTLATFTKIATALGVATVLTPVGKQQ